MEMHLVRDTADLQCLGGDLWSTALNGVNDAKEGFIGLTGDRIDNGYLH